MKYFIQLIRPINLLIIAFTMYSTRLFLYLYELRFNVNLFQRQGEEIDFFLMVLSTVMIGAAGNMINDYFDVKADRVNKPEKVIITKFVKRRAAILYHWILNILAFSIAIYLSVRNNSFWYVFIHLISINALWFYSLYFKRKAFIGNFIVACLTALVPILCGIHFYVHHQLPFLSNVNLDNITDYWIYQLGQKGHFIWILAIFAFLANLSREIIKDIEDRKGDILLNAKTLPIIYGTKTSKWLAGWILILAPITFLLLYLFKAPNLFDWKQALQLFLPVISSFIINFIAIVILYKAKTRTRLKITDNLIKIGMLAGVLLPFYWFTLI
jgi:4-hydroxybenzoate polyprenyltransferase